METHNRAFPSLLPKPQVATKADLARPNTHEPETLRQPGGPATHCYLCCEEWRPFDERGRRRRWETFWWKRRTPSTGGQNTSEFYHDDLRPTNYHQ